jgi:hypothetical protein
VQGAFCKNFAKEFRFSAKNWQPSRRKGKNPLQSACLWGDSTGFRTWIKAGNGFKALSTTAQVV